MGYTLLNVIQGTDSVSALYVCKGTHPPPRRHRPQAPTKLTHNHSTGFPRWPCRGALLGRPFRWSPAPPHWLDNIIDTAEIRWCHWSNEAPFIWFSLLRKTGRDLLRLGVQKLYSAVRIQRCRTRRRALPCLDSWGNFTPKGFISSKLRKYALSNGINFNSIVGLLLFTYG